MFTGIIEELGQVQSFQPRGEIYEMVIKRPESFNDIALGDSIAHDGVCLTVEKFTPTTMTFALGQETLDVTNSLKRISVGSQINLERSLKFGDRVHGHLVSGHVDALGTLTARAGSNDFLKLEVTFPASIAPLIWPKGSIAINGVSLTVNKVAGTSFEVGLIPETLKRTNLGELKVGDQVNLETDQFARGLLRLREVLADQIQAQKNEPLT